MKNILVTGGAGYIGSHACKALRRAGFNPVTFDNFSTGWRDAVKFGPCFEGDLLKKEDINNAFNTFRPIAVMHFAAFSQVGESVQHPNRYWENNFVGSLNLVNAALKFGCRYFILSSTCATYGDQDGEILDECSHQLPNNPYASSKYAIEQMLRDFSKSDSLHYVIFRYFNVAGADPEAEIGEFHRPETHLIPLILDVMSGTRDKITVHGTDYDTPDGTCVRDYVHVCDLIDAHILGLKFLLNSGESSVFNIGTGHGFSVKEVIQKATQITNRQINFKNGERRPGDCAKLVSGSSKLVDTLGYSLHRSNLTEMITDAWRWHQRANYKR